MALWLQIILALVLVALAAYLVPLLIQLRRTAAAMERLADSARQDLRQMAEDVHGIRTRADGLMDLVGAALEMPAALGRILGGATRSFGAFLGKGGPSWTGALLTGFKFAMNLIRRRRKAAGSKEDCHE